MPTVYLIRHGQASFGTEEYDRLSALGVTQAEETGYSLCRRGLRPSRAVSGSLRRQRDSAAACLAAAGLDDLGTTLTVDGRWDEYDHLALVRHTVPSGAGVPPRPGTRAFQEALDTALLGWIEAAVSSGGGWAAFRDGVNAALGEVFGTLPGGGSAVVFTSAGPIAAVAAALLGLPPAGVVALNRVAVNSAITTIVRGRSGTSLLTFNDHAHFTGARGTLLTYR